MILNKFGKPSIYLPGCMVVWGLISCLTTVTKDFGGLLAVRFFLGFVEAAYFVRTHWLLLTDRPKLLIPSSLAVSISYLHGIQGKN